MLPWTIAARRAGIHTAADATRRVPIAVTAAIDTSRTSAGDLAAPRAFRTPGSLPAIPYSLFPIPYSLFPIPDAAPAQIPTACSNRSR